MIYPIIKISDKLPLTKPKDLDQKNHPLQGEKEYKFFCILQKYFGNRIKRHKKIAFENNKFYPDYIYFDEDFDFIIDIELDEPYIKANLEPIHYLGIESDIYRNNFMLESGWSIIRFSEYQSIKHGEECIKVIKDVIKALKSNETFILRKFKYPNLFIHPIWTEDDAQKMARNSIRDRYGFKFSEVLEERPENIKMILTSDEELTNILLEYILLESLFEIDRKNDFLFFIADISDILVHEETQVEYILISLNSSRRLLDSGRFDLGSDIPLCFKLEKESHPLYNKLTEAKKKGKVIRFNYEYSHSYYNLFLKGKKNETEENHDLLELKSLKSWVNSIYIYCDFLLPNIYFNESN